MAFNIWNEFSECVCHNYVIQRSICVKCRVVGQLIFDCWALNWMDNILHFDLFLDTFVWNLKPREFARGSMGHLLRISLYFCTKAIGVGILRSVNCGWFFKQILTC